MRLEQSPSAERDLVDITDYTLAQHGAAQTIAYLDAIEAAFRRLADHPQIGVARHDLRPGLRSFPCGEHRIFYLVQGETVLVVRVLHKAMDAGWYLLGEV